MSKVRRIYVEKRPAYAVRANELEKEFKDYLGLQGIRVRELVVGSMPRKKSRT